MTYGDSSFLLAVYHRTDFFNAPAIKIASQLKQPFPLTLLGELELVNGVCRCFAAKTIDRQENDAIFRQISDDEADGILVRHVIDQKDMFAGARALSKKYTPEIAARSLDILHVASAQILRADTFISFDGKQRLLAQKVGMRLLPRILAVRGA